MLRGVLVLCVCAGVAAGLFRGLEFNRSVKRFKALKYSDNLHEDANLKVPELVMKYGYPLEVHRITTSDGYILTMHRIPHGRDRNSQPNSNRPVVFLMHGLLSSSADWVVMGPGKGLAYILAEEGFDVWMGNARGNRYSRANMYRSPDAHNVEFWQFSWDEIGNIDLPSMIDYALENTQKQQLHYIGHSQGTTAFFVMCSLRPDYNQKITSMNALAPVAYLAYSGCPLLRAIAPFSGHLNHLFKLIGVGEFFPNTRIMKWAGEALCRDRAITQGICTSIMFLIGGWNAGQSNKTMLPVQLAHAPAGASVRQFAHYGQSLHSKQFRRYNHGWWNNMRVYGTLNAPLYDLSQVRAPVYLHYSLADPLTNVKDVQRLWSEIGNPVQKNIVPMSSFSHLDFLWGLDAKTLVYDQVINIMKEYGTV